MMHRFHQLKRAALAGGMLFLCHQQASAAVVFYQPATTIQLDHGDAKDQRFNIDLDGDGNYELQWRSVGGAAFFQTWDETRVIGKSLPGSSVITEYPFSRPYCLLPGAIIGADSPADFPQDGSWAMWNSHPLQYPSGATLYVEYDVGTEGYFYAKEGYMGVQFLIEGQVHYGWLEISNDFLPPHGLSLQATKILGWAYETEPGKPIVAGAIPEPSGTSIAVLAATGLLLRRRRF